MPNFNRNLFPKETELSLQYRASIITLRVFCELSWGDVEKKLGIPADTCRRVFKRTTDAAGGSEDIHDLLNACAPCSRSGRPEKVPEGSKKSLEIRDAMVEDDTTPWLKVSIKKGFGPSHGTMKKIAGHTDEKRGHLGRKRAALKPYLSNIAQSKSPLLLLLEQLLIHKQALEFSSVHGPSSNCRRTQSLSLLMSPTSTLVE